MWRHAKLKGWKSLTQQPLLLSACLERTSDTRRRERPRLETSPGGVGLNDALLFICQQTLVGISKVPSRRLHLWYRREQEKVPVRKEVTVEQGKEGSGVGGGKRV